MRAACLIIALAAALSAQVAKEANSGYQTPDQRQGMIRSLSNPERDNTQRPAELVREMKLRPGDAVADIGTGAGYMLPYLSQAVGAKGRVVAEDIFDDFLAAARENAAAKKLTNVTFVKGTETDPKLPEKSLDQILILDAYHHFDYPEKMLAGIHNALKPGGKLVIVEYHKTAEAMPNGRALTHIRLAMPDVIKEIEANRFRLITSKEFNPKSQYMLILEPK